MTDKTNETTSDNQKPDVAASAVKRLVIYAVYTDKGPRGICGQACSITSPWRKLHIFYDHDEFRGWARSLEKLSARKSPKIEYFWVEDEFCNDIIKHI